MISSFAWDICNVFKINHAMFFSGSLLGINTFAQTDLSLSNTDSVILTNYVDCDGTEESLLDCDYSSDSECFTEFRASVECIGKNFVPQ